ncbi:Type 1 glutamine amidotransferase-like domain-containing protein [Candidatus Pacearchaeota archaeon]|nr:Type 1 glutamine amidotransferase-like domain-containing protein [Candidatus Pacearchaeota archaeon]
MVKKIYLIGGGNIRSGETKELDSKALSEAENKNVYVINLTTNDKQKIKDYKEFMVSYLKSLNAQEINFLSDFKSHKETKTKINSSGLIYIMGGDTEILIENIKKMKIAPIIKSFKGIILGNSAGAYLLCRGYVKTKDSQNEEIVKGLGFIKFYIKVHYNKEFDKNLLKLSRDKEIYGVPEKCAIVLNDNLKFIGDIYLFSKGRKNKIN